VLFDDQAYNITLGSAYFSRLVGAFRGLIRWRSRPIMRGGQCLALAGQPGRSARQSQYRLGGMGGAHPHQRNAHHVAHVLENAVTYEAMNP
jgi:hypothetical protein